MCVSRRRTTSVTSGRWGKRRDAQLAREPGIIKTAPRRESTRGDRHRADFIKRLTSAQSAFCLVRDLSRLSSRLPASKGKTLGKV